MKILVVTSVFTNSKQPGLGIFVRERMFKVAQHCELKVVAPVPWFPFAHHLKKGYRPSVPYLEVQEGIEVYHPRFFNVPRYFKFLDGFFFFLTSCLSIRKIRKEFHFDIIDSHFAYPDGLGAVLLGRLFRVPVTITIRGTIRKYAGKQLIRPQISYALAKAARIFAVCDDLRQAALDFFPCQEKAVVVGNGVDTNKFYLLDRQSARQALNLGPDRKILISIGGLTERKGFHRIIRVLPQLMDRFPDILMIIVGGGSVEGNNEPALRRLVSELKLEDSVFFAGAQTHDQLCRWLNAADVFCLATSNEGWANVFLEAMACGLPVVTTDVGGNREVVCSEEVGILVPFDDDNALQRALADALLKNWDTEKIVEYAQCNTWEKRVALLMQNFRDVIRTSRNERG
jgi:glycosyltransferase involved in cell wall biosynthesis